MVIQCDAIVWEQFFAEGDFVLDMFNKESRDEDKILDQIYEKQLFLDFYNEDLNVLTFHEKA